MYDSSHPYVELHVSPNGPSYAQPAALQIIRDHDLFNKLTDRVILVIGATSGLGVETARTLRVTSADVFITARDIRMAQDVIDNIKKSSQESEKLEVIEVDMNSFDSVKKAARAFLTKPSKLNILVNNADVQHKLNTSVYTADTQTGIMATPEESKISDGFEQQFGVNQLAHFTLTTLLLPTLISSSTISLNSRTIALTPNGYRYSTIN